MATTGRSSFTIVAGPEFTLLGNALRDVDARLPGELRKKMKDAIKPAIADAKNHIRTMQVAGHSGHTGLRRKVAVGVRAQAGVGATPYMRIVTTMPNANESVIPRGFDRAMGWRHPVFGDREHWVRQRPLESGWFRPVIASHRDDIQDSLVNTLEWAANLIADSAHV